jgi:hypothetical protein
MCYRKAEALQISLAKKRECFNKAKTVVEQLLEENVSESLLLENVSQRIYLFFGSIYGRRLQCHSDFVACVEVELFSFLFHNF